MCVKESMWLGFRAVRMEVLVVRWWVAPPPGRFLQLLCEGFARLISYSFTMGVKGCHLSCF